MAETVEPLDVTASAFQEQTAEDSAVTRRGAVAQEAKARAATTK